MRGLLPAARRWACTIAAAPVLLPGAALHAQPGRPGGERPGLERLARVVQMRLALTDAQAARVRALSARYAERRQTLQVREREARGTIRDEVQRDSLADQGRLRSALDALVSAQQQRAALVADEQRELASFLTPLQRARFLGMQERAFRAAQRFRRAREERGRGGSPPE